MTLQERLMLYLEQFPGPKTYRYLPIRDVFLWQDIVDKTFFLPNNSIPSQRCWHIMNNIWEVQTCQITRMPVKWECGKYLTYYSLSAITQCPVISQRKTSTRRKNQESKIGKSISERETYRKDVWRHTKRNWKLFKTNIEGWELRSRSYHLDHVVSIKDGFESSVDPQIIGHWCNFRIVSAIENQTKNAKSDMSIEKLLERYHNFTKN